MRVVVTRPIRSGQKTATLLRERGHQPILLPMTEPVYKTDVTRETLARKPAALAVTSAEAIRALSASSVDLSNHLDRPLFAVGEATAKAARDVGFRTIIGGDGDGVALARLVQTTFKLQASEPAPDDGSPHLLYLAGRPREGGFESTLAENAIRVSVAEIYEMQPVHWERPTLQARFEPLPDVVLLYSRKTARIFFELSERLDLASLISAIRFICISENVLDVVPAIHRSRALASATPREDAMFHLLDRGAGT